MERDDINLINKYNNFNISKILKLVKKEKITYIRLKLIIVLKKKEKVDKIICLEEGPPNKKEILETVFDNKILNFFFW